ncbi:helicase POLQ-like isoform X2 [Prorops nasuta]|uniref:helicase POLQ-like isoform X2 n=1 Tax=Prorops nasuta TaxID=863751 RepID=UPI0034CF65C9
MLSNKQGIIIFKTLNLALTCLSTLHPSSTKYNYLQIFLVQSMAPLALNLGFLIEEYAATKGQYPPKRRMKKNGIYICTIEKAQSLLNSLIELNRLSEIGTIVVDELHLLGENGGRGATLEVLLTKVMYVDENIHIVGMSATIGNLKEVAQFLKAELYTQNFRPIIIKEYLKCEDSIWLIDVENTKDILTEKKKINYRYSQNAIALDPDKIGGLVMDVVPQDACLIFCSSRANCENVALLLSKVLFRSLLNYKQKEKEVLKKALEGEAPICPILSKTIAFGVAYHHSGLTSQERQLLEEAFREGILCVICCTSTLAAGVNLPARRVILRNPYIGNQFITLSRYKQMTGRAGRAGLGEMGESILICKRPELPAVKDLFASKMDDCLSSLHMEKDKGIHNLILSAIFLSITSTKFDLYNLFSSTLCAIQQDRLTIDVKNMIDEAVNSFLRSGILKVKYEKPHISADTESNIDLSQTKLQNLETEAGDAFELSELGRAAIKGSIELQSAYNLYTDLKTAQNHLILSDCLHLLYLVTPYNTTNQVKIIESVYYDEALKLTSGQMATARLLGINEATIGQIRNGIMPKNIDPRVVQRFYITLILYEFWNQQTVYSIAQKYQISRGVVQNLLTTVASFASAVVRFCQELKEFWAFAEIFCAFSKKLSYCCPAELEILMELPGVKIGRAYQLFNAGYKTLQNVASADPKALQETVKYMSKRSVKQMIASAHLLILQKVEDLRDEAAHVLQAIFKFNISLLIIIQYLRSKKIVLYRTIC